MHSDTYNEMMTARAEGEPEPEPKLVVTGGTVDPNVKWGVENGPELFIPGASVVVQAQAAEVDSSLIVPTGAEDDITHYVGDDCPGGHYDDPVAVPVEPDPYLLSPPPPRVDGVTDGTTFYVRNGVRIAFPGDHTADEVEEAFRGAGF